VAMVPDDGTLHVNTPMVAPIYGSLTLLLQHMSGIDNLLAIDNVAFSQFATPIAGDFNYDGVVDGSDFAAWQINFPKSSGATLGQGDADGDGDVDGADFVVWQTNFSQAPNASQVAEPSTVWLLLAVAPFAVAWQTKCLEASRLSIVFLRDMFSLR
jgi:hypothetical protein